MNPWLEKLRKLQGNPQWAVPAEDNRQPLACLQKSPSPHTNAQEILPECEAGQPNDKSACSYCGTTAETWEFNEGTCWARIICWRCQSKVRMPPVHLCNPSLPLTEPCKGQERRQWVCSTGEAKVEIESRGERTHCDLLEVP